jgi:hypothetical protein
MTTRYQVNSSVFQLSETLDELEELNGCSFGSISFGSIEPGTSIRFQQALASLAETARERILRHAIAALVSDGIGISASFVRNVVSTKET